MPGRGAPESPAADAGRMTIAPDVTAPRRRRRAGAARSGARRHDEHAAERDARARPRDAREDAARGLQSPFSPIPSRSPSSFILSCSPLREILSRRAACVTLPFVCSSARHDELALEAAHRDLHLLLEAALARERVAGSRSRPAAARAPDPALPRSSGGQVLDAELLRVAEEHRALDHVLELADVARPRVRREDVERPRARRRRPAS